MDAMIGIPSDSLQKEAKTVFILGAGASKEAGVPLMTEFLDQAYELMRTTELDAVYPDARKSFGAVFDQIENLQRIYAKSFVDLQNVESVFSAFEMLSLLGAGKTLTGNLPDHMRKLIEVTVEETTNFRWDGQKVLSAENYENFATYLVDFLKKYKRAAVITFNYDLSLDYALYRRKVPFRYKLPGETQELTAEDNPNLLPVLPYLKLHGSLNWGYCLGNKNLNEVCKEIKPVNIEKYFEIIPPSEPVNSIVRLHPFRLPNQSCHGPLGTPLIVPPTWNKTEYYRTIAGIWQAAFQELGRAENIIICGYSLPETDMFFRYLFALGTMWKTRLKRLWVFNPDQERPNGTLRNSNEKGMVQERFESMLGVIGKQRLKFFNGGDGHFSNAILTLKQDLPVWEKHSK